jgi:hypothetical protein
MHGSQTIVALMLAAALAVAGCSGDDSGAKSTEAGSTDPPPDPCALVSAGALAELTGRPTGEGEFKAVAPDQRKSCVFDDGLSLSVEVGENYEATVNLIKATPGESTVETVEGVGSAAIWQDFGAGIGQLLANGDDYFVGVTVSAGGSQVGRTVAEAMLAEL